MPAFPEDIDELQPLPRRYDVPVEDDFVLSILPNGIKTWVLLYEQNGRMRRRTLGVYPDMDLDQARVALAKARALRSRFKDRFDEAPALLTGTYSDGLFGKRWQKLLWIAAIAVFLVLAASILISVSGTVPKPALPEIAVPATTPVETSPALTQAAPVPPASDGEQRPTPGESPSAGPEVAAASEPAAAPPEELGAADPAPAEETPTSSAIVPYEPRADPPATRTTADAAQGAPSDSEPADSAAPPTADSPAAEPLSQLETAEVHASLTIDERPPAPAVAPAPEPEPLSQTQNAARVTRAQLAGAVVDLEPQDALGDVVRGRPGATTRVFYFTELKGLQGETVTHRWEHEGELRAEVPIRVGQSWRWRAYSSKDLMPGRTGAWHVAAIAPDGRVLAEASFVYELEQTD